MTPPITDPNVAAMREQLRQIREGADELKPLATLVPLLQQRQDSTEELVPICDAGIDQTHTGISLFKIY